MVDVVTAILDELFSCPCEDKPRLSTREQLLSARVPGGYKAIVSDPPWVFSDQGSRITPRYDLMSNVDVENLPLAELAAPDSYLFLWCPSALLDVGIGALKWAGYTLKSTVVWIKTTNDGAKLRISAGHHLRNAHELCLVGTRGKITSIDRSIPSVIFAPRGEHSAKPEELQDIVERMVPEGPFLEMFARRVRKTWTCFGNEIGGVVHASQSARQDDHERPDGDHQDGEKTPGRRGSAVQRRPRRIKPPAVREG